MEQETGASRYKCLRNTSLYPINIIIVWYQAIAVKPVQTGFSHVLVSVVIHVHKNREYIMVQLHVIDQKYPNG